MTRTYTKDTLNRTSYFIRSEIFDKTTHVGSFSAFIKDGYLVRTESWIHVRGYNLLSEQRLFSSRLSSILDGSTDVVSSNGIASCLGRNPVALDLDF